MTGFYTLDIRRGRSPLVLLVALLLAAQTALGAGEPIYSAGGASVTQTCLTCTVKRPNLAADSDFNTGATIQIPVSLLGGVIRLRMDLAKEAPKNYHAGVVVKRNGGLLGLLGADIAGGLRLRTFRNSVVQESMPVSAGLVKAALGQATDAVRLQFLATKPFDQIELEAGSLLSVGFDLDVLYAYAIDANVIEKTEGFASRFDNPATSNYSTQVTGDNDLTVCVNSGVDNPQNAVDNDLTNYATLVTTAGVSCPSTLQVQLEGPAPAGYEAGFVLGSGGLLDLSVLDNLRITTYQGGMMQEQAIGRDLLRLQVLPNGQTVVRFTTTKPFDHVELQRTSLLSALDNLQVDYGFGVTPSTFRDETPQLSAFANTTNNYQVGGTTSLISNPQLAADTALTGNAASVGSLVGLLTAPRLKLRLDGAGKAGNTAGVVLGLGTGLLDVDVLKNVRIRTYSGTDGGTLVETATGASLLNVELLAGGRSEVSFLTTQDFDWVEVEFLTGVALLSNTNVYYAFAEDRPSGFPAAIVTPSGPLPVQLTAFVVRARGLSVEVSWETATELNSDYFEVERSAEAGRGFVVVDRQQAAGTSTGSKHYTLTDAAAAQLPAGVLYYRLRQVDLDGTETYSAVAAVMRRPLAAPLALYPNPASAGSSLRIGGLAALPEGRYELRLYSMQGALVSRQALRATAAEVLLPNLGAGVYQAVVSDAAGRLVGRQRLVVTQGR